MDKIALMYCIFWMIYISQKKKCNRIKKIIGQVFFVEWMAILILSNFNFYEIYDVSWKVMFGVLMHVVFFSIGYDINWGCRVKSNLKSINIKKNVKEKYGLFVSAIAWMAIVPLCIIFYRYMLYASKVGVGTARVAIFQAGEIFHSTTECQLYLYFGYAYFFIFSMLLIYGIYTKSIFRTAIFIPTLLGISIYLITGAGRLEYIVLACEFFIVYIIKNNNKKKKKHNEKLMILGVGGAICFGVVLVTGRRFGIDRITWTNVKELLELSFSQIYIYAVGPLRAFDYALNNYIGVLGYNWGRMTLGAVDELIGWCFTVLHLPYDIMNFYYGGITQDTIYIGDGYGFNALYTSLFHFYFDFGWMGIAVFSFVFGILLNYAIKRVERRCSIPNLIILCLMFYTMLMLPISWKMSAPAMLIILGVSLYWDNVCARYNKY